MGKRSDFERNPRDYYPTPYDAVLPLLPHLDPKTIFVEPCAGDGRLIRHLEKHGHQCKYACDIEPQGPAIHQRDVLFFDQGLPECHAIITNPPWKRETMHPMIDLFRNQADTWLLFDADWMHTIQAVPFLPYCQLIVSVGRVKWIEDSDHDGMDNACWYKFIADHTETTFIGKTA